MIRRVMTIQLFRIADILSAWARSANVPSEKEDQSVLAHAGGQDVRDPISSWLAW
jgi:hypothetical protein